MTSDRLLRPRLAVLAPHPVQYHVPLYRGIERSGLVDQTVLFCDRVGLEPRFEAAVGATIAWDYPLLGGYRHTFLRNLGAIRRRNPLFSRLNPGILPALVRRRSDVVLVQGHTFATAWLAAIAAKLLRRKVLFRAEGVLRPGHDGGNRLRKAPLRGMIRIADHVFFSCSGNRRFLEHFGARPQRMSLIPCAVDNDFFEAQRWRMVGERPEIRRHLGLKEEWFYVCSASRFDSEKRVPDIVRAVGHCQRQGLRVGAVLVGAGSERPLVDGAVSDGRVEEIHLPGWLNLTGISEVFAVSDAFVIASDFDPSPKALSEALVFCLPIITSDVIGTAGDLARDGYNGFLFPVGSAPDLADRIARLAKDPDLCRVMGERSREIAGEWSIAAAAASVIRATYSVLDRPVPEDVS